MAETFGQVLRSLREHKNLSLSGLASRLYCHKTKLGHVETGVRRPSVEFAKACDQVLGTSPLLSVLLEIDRQGDDMKRRALMAGISGAVAFGGISGASALADVVRHGLLDTTGDGEDWNALVESYSRRLVTDPSAEFGSSLLGQVMMVRFQIVDRGPTPERLSTLAELGQLYGLWLGNQDDVASARNWYRTATAVADRSEDTSTRIYVRGRTLSRGIYEGTTVRETVDGVHEALSLSKSATLGALEAYSALVHVHGLTGNLPEGRKAVAGMRDIVEELPDAEVKKIAGPVQRTASFASYLECRVGKRRDAERAFAEAEPVLRPVPVWLADAKVYYARAAVADGDVSDGIAYALTAIKGLSSDVRVVGLGVSDLLSVVPPGYRSDELDELRTYAATGPGPWETIV